MSETPRPHSGAGAMTTEQDMLVGQMDKLVAYLAVGDEGEAADLVSKASDHIEAQSSLLKTAIEALGKAREAIASLEPDALGMAQIGFGSPDDVYPIRDELLAEIDAILKSSMKDK